ncbi:CYTH and CHAD domain-containing protein [Streptomyces formicae]|uniref:CYTH and CHAD domain-containing protein n=1 Tax=Streptomyces formicae TaxID=1616117 RepID=A0ABY3WXC4_9ACTN|nr:CYTH and CHAD domain-containing protein [Streptomyces formicae]UNM15156.1 CYTH and CHAD domain-containing protein [Streptomyces formicae]
MADTKREIERKYEAGTDTELPDLTGVPGVGDIVGKGVAELDAVYHDTTGLRLAADGITLRRRTGGGDEGWHLKFPVSAGIRDEIRSPLSDALPRAFAGLVRSRTRGAELVPVVRLLSSRDIHHLLDEQGELLAELSVDSVRAERLTDGGGTASWTEIEVELADDADPAILDAVDKQLRKAGLSPSAATSKLARALEETGPAVPQPTEGEATGAKAEKAPKAAKAAKAVRDSGARLGPKDAGEYVLAYLREQRDAIIALDPAVRRDLPDAVHQMRVATRRMRSAFKTFRKVVDRGVTDPLGDELKWLAGELGAARDQEVLAERLRDRIDALPRTLVLGPVRGRLRIWATAHRADARRRSVAVLDTDRYLALLDSLDALLDAPPLLKDATAGPADALPKAVIKDYGRLSARVDHALGLPAGHDRDTAMHDARKAAKRARYAAEAATPALGKPAKRFAKAMKAVQTVLGDHQDSVVARDTIRDLGIQAHAAGETAFTWGLLFGHEEASAADRERELPGVWENASRPALRQALAG